MKKNRTYRLSSPRSRTELIESFEAMRASANPPYWHLISQEDRDKAASSGAAMPDGSYPILTCDGDNSVDSAIHAVGRGNANHDAIRKHIITRAKSLGCSSKIPDNWNADGSLAASGVVAAGDPDAQVSAGVKALQSAVDQLRKEQAADPDDTTDANDVEVTKLLGQIDTLVTQLAAAQTKDTSQEADPPKAPADPVDDVETQTGDSEPCPTCKGEGKLDDGTVCPTCAGEGNIVSKAKPDPTMNPATVPDSKMAAKPDTAQATDGPINPVDEEGNVDPDAVCATSGCSHVASVHQDTDTGANTGACTTPGCKCQQMTFASNNADVAVTDTGDEGDGETVATPSDDSKMAAIFPPSAPAPVVTIPDLPQIIPADSKVNEAPTVEGGSAMGPAFVIPCGIILGQATDDGRALGKDSLTWLNFPLPLMGQATATHDPMGMDQNAPAVLCGRIDSVEITPGENGTQLVSAKGFFLPDDDGLYYADKVAAMGRMGISADVKVFASAIMPGEVDDFGFPTGEGMQEIVTDGELSGFTIVTPSPAFPQCYIKIDDGTDDVPSIPQKSDEDSKMEQITASAQLVHFMASERCVPCGEMDIISEAESIVAGGFVDAPMRPPKAWFENPHFTPDDGRTVEIFSGRGSQRLGGQWACPLTITDEGEVFGHIAPWGVCHTGMKGQCVTAPHSNMNYSQFMRAGQQVKTAEGDLVRVGVLTFDTGHADLSGKLSARNVQRHYDDTGTAWADVVCGDDEHGIWIHGALRPNITELQLRQIRAASPSGDWRECEGGLELMAILQVNQPGFPIAMVARGQTMALVSAGALTMEIARKVDDAFNDEDGHAWERIAKRLLPLAAKEALVRLDDLQREVAEYHLSRLDAI
jgi:hypothetical protein